MPAEARIRQKSAEQMARQPQHDKALTILHICRGPEITPQRFITVRSPYIARYSSTNSSAASLVVPYRDRCPLRGKLSEMPLALTPSCCTPLRRKNRLSFESSGSERSASIE